MSVLIVTSLGDVVIDLFTDKCPLTCKNFLKLCKMKYYNGCLFHTVQKDFTTQTGDPTGTGAGGDSIYKFLYGDQARFFSDEIHLDLKHTKTGTVAMANAGENLNASQFYITLRDGLDYLDGKHTVFAEVAEGFEALTRINEAFVDDKNRPLKNIRIKHTYILEDPFDDPSQLAELIPDASPEGKPKDEVDDEVRLEDDWVPLDEQLAPEELEEVLRQKDAHSSAVVLESIGDIPEAEVKPPDNVLFVCKLNPVTEDDDLHTIFSRFGTVVSAEIIRDHKTGDSLCYAFIEFENKDSCELAYFKMDNALIDDRRIHVDFSQSVAKLWSQYRRNSNQTNKGRGCFKCGAPDHLAKDCTEGPGFKQPPKYVLKDDNVQHGGNRNSRYDMVFDEEPVGSPRREKRHRGHDADKQAEKQNMHKRNFEDTKPKDLEKKYSSDKHRQDSSNRDYRESQYGERRRDRDYIEERRDREKHLEKQRDTDNGSRDRQDYDRKSDVDGRRERRDDGEYGKRSADYERHTRNWDDRDSHKRRADNDRNMEKRGDTGHRIDADDGNKGKTRDERDHRKRSSDRDRQGKEDEPGYRKRGNDDNDHRSRRGGREHHGQDVDHGHDRDKKYGGHGRR